MASSSSSQDEKTPKFDPNIFNISKANDEEITEFIRNRVENYKVNSEWKNETLWEYFQEDFEGFTISNFETSKDGIRHLRDHLRKNGINIPGGKGYKISKALFELLQEDEPHVLGATSITSVIASPPNIVPPIRTGRELTELSKIYRDDMKYGGSEDRLDYMLSIFYSLCLRANVRPDQYVLAASIMLKKSALQYYFMAFDPHLTSSSTFDEIVTKLRNNFEGSEHKQMIFQMWGNTTLKSIITKNPGRTVLQNLETLIDELELTSVVALPGFVNNPYAFMSKASVLAMSSVCEGFGNVIAEALACGTPVVSTDCPSGPSEILEYGKYGTLVPLADPQALAEAILTTLTSATDSEALRQRAKTFSIETAVDSYLEILDPNSVKKTLTPNNYVKA